VGSLSDSLFLLNFLQLSCSGCIEPSRCNVLACAHRFYPVARVVRAAVPPLCTGPVHRACVQPWATCALAQQPCSAKQCIMHKQYDIVPHHALETPEPRQSRSYIQQVKCVRGLSVLKRQHAKQFTHLKCVAAGAGHHSLCRSCIKYDTSGYSKHWCSTRWCAGIVLQHETCAVGLNHNTAYAKQAVCQYRQAAAATVGAA
jgi:hypothetical protein